MPTSVVLFVGVVLAIYVAWASLLFALQRSMMFPGAGAADGPPRPTPQGFEVWQIEEADCSVEAWFHAAKGTGEPGPAVIFAHGNGELIDDWNGAFQRLADHGISVLLVEFPGYGRSSGKPSQASVVATIKAAYDRLAELPAVDDQSIVGVGRSLGGGAVCALSSERWLAGLVLMSTFTSARWFARRYAVPGLLVRDPFDNRRAVARFDRPILLIHGSRDATIPWWHSKKLAAVGRDTELIIHDADHSTCPPDWDDFLRVLEGFVRTCVGWGVEGEPSG